MMNEQLFFSVDRLVEFGMSAAIARQMVGMMNESLKAMYIPGSIDAIRRPVALPRIIYVALDGEAEGPFGESELTRLIADGRVNLDTLAWMPGMAQWQPVRNAPEILKIIALTPPPLP